MHMRMHRTHTEKCYVGFWVRRVINVQLVDLTDYNNNLLKPLEQSWQDYYRSYQPPSVLIGFVAHWTGWNSCLYCKSGQTHMGTHCCCIAG